MSNLLLADLKGSLPIQSTLLTVEEFEAALADDVLIQQSLKSILEKTQEVQELTFQITHLTRMKSHKEAVKRRIRALEEVVKRRRQAVCKKLIHQKIKQARKEMGVTTTDVS